MRSLTKIELEGIDNYLSKFFQAKLFIKGQDFKVKANITKRDNSNIIKL